MARWIGRGRVAWGSATAAEWAMPWSTDTDGAAAAALGDGGGTHGGGAG